MELKETKPVRHHMCLTVEDGIVTYKMMNTARVMEDILLA